MRTLRLDRIELHRKLEEIFRLLIEAYDHYFSYETHCKSSEGVVTLSFPTYWELSEGKREPQVSIYSYALGDSRNNDFENIDEALAAVREWHRREMAYVPEEDFRTVD